MREAEAGRRQSGDLAVPDRRRADCADRAAAGGRRLRGARDELRQPRTRDGGDHHRRRLGARQTVRFSTRTCASASASSSSAFSAATGAWSSIPNRTRDYRRRRQARGPRPARIAQDGSKRRLEEMAARLLDGVAVAAAIRAEVRPPSRRSRRRSAARPGWASSWSANDPASEVYVGSKLKSAGETGLRADLERLPATASLADLLTVVDAVEPERGARRHPGAVAAARGDGPGCGAAGLRRRAGRTRTWTGFIRSTSAGSCRTARRSSRARRRASSNCSSDREIRIAGTHAVVIGRSDIVGKPMALLLLHRHATVTICHSRTPNLPQVAAEADILVAAIGRPAFVTRGVREARRDRRRRRHDAGHGSRGRRAAVSRRDRSDARRSNARPAGASATCTRMWRRSPARCRPCRAASGR